MISTTAGRKNKGGKVRWEGKEKMVKDKEKDKNGSRQEEGENLSRKEKGKETGFI